MSWIYEHVDVATLMPDLLGLCLLVSWQVVVAERQVDGLHRGQVKSQDSTNSLESEVSVLDLLGGQAAKCLGNDLILIIEQILASQAWSITE